MVLPPSLPSNLYFFKLTRLTTEEKIAPSSLYLLNAQQAIFNRQKTKNSLLDSRDKVIYLLKNWILFNNGIVG